MLQLYFRHLFDAPGEIEEDKSHVFKISEVKIFCAGWQLLFGRVIYNGRSTIKDRTKKAIDRTKFALSDHFIIQIPLNWAQIGLSGPSDRTTKFSYK